MSESTVRLLTSTDPVEYRTVSVDDVPAGYCRVRIRDHGEFYADAEALNITTEPRHPEFSPEVRAELSALLGRFHGLVEKTDDEWADGFRCDAHPWREIAGWHLMADTLHEFAGHLDAGSPTGREKMQDLFAVILSLFNSGPPGPGGGFKAHRSVTAGRVRQIAGWLFSRDRDPEQRERVRRLRRLVAPGGVPVPPRVTIDALTDGRGGPNHDAPFDVYDALDQAEVIIAVDVDTGRESLVYGRDNLKRIAASGNSEPLPVLHVELDIETDELERLVAAVAAVKGRHDYE